MRKASKAPLDVRMKIGKGGVGKSTLAVTDAIAKAKEGLRGCLMDGDGGKASARVFNFENYPVNELTPTPLENLSFVSVQDPRYTELDARKEMTKQQREKAYKDYIQQFPHDYGLAAFNDMIRKFFGVFSDVRTLHKFITIVRILHEINDANYDYVVIDMEPTSGFKQFINSMDDIVRSLENLSATGQLLRMIMSGHRRHIVAFLNGEYMAGVEAYIQKLKNAQKMIKAAHFSAVTTSEREAVQQLIEDVIPFVDDIGGQLTEVFMNKYGSLEDPVFEAEQLEYVKRMISPRGVPVITVPRLKGMLHPEHRDRDLSEIADIIHHASA